MIKATEYLFRNCLEKTAGVSLRIDEYLSYCGEVSELLKNQTASQNVSTQDADGKDADSYVSTIGSSDAVMPSENYNDILKEIQKTKAEAGRPRVTQKTQDRHPEQEHPDRSHRHPELVRLEIPEAVETAMMRPQQQRRL